MNTYQKITALIEQFKEDFKSPANNNVFKDALRDAIGALEDIKSFY